jgi:pimeloyl-ACP methyl ester carboxylesterase
MDTTVDSQVTLAFEQRGAGTPVVLLHGLTFDRTSWRPIVDRLGGAVRTITLDLSGHGESPAGPMSVDGLSALVHEHVASLGVERPVVVGHSFGAAVASLYAARFPSLGLVTVDNGPDVQPLAELVQRMAPMLRGPGFPEAWAAIESSLGLELIPEPFQSLVRAGHRVDQQLVLGYWEQMLTTPPAELQAYIDAFLPRITVPVLAVYGNPPSPGDRQRFEHYRDVRLEEHPGDGHFVHLVDPDRFAASLLRFVASCSADG